jgi:hypothetical protein
MATTKVIPEVIDLNQASSTTGLRMPKGSSAYAAPPTVAEGMMRNEVGQVSNGSASCMQHFNDTEWKNYDNLSNTVAVDFLVIGGGGGAGFNNAGGGGAGGYKTSYGSDLSGNSSATLSGLTIAKNTSLTLTVGANGVGTVYPGNVSGDDGTAGTGSSIIVTGGATLVSTSGGGAGRPSGGAVPGPVNGGSGGGGAYGSGAEAAGGTGISDEGGAGGTGTPGTPWVGGGGGGASGNATGSPHPRNGGNGLPSTIISAASPTTRAGGGGAGADVGSSTGGSGGGGAASTGAGADATGVGSGGGGGGFINNGSGAGSDGIIILRYPAANAITTPTGSLTTGALNATVTDGGTATDKYTTFTSGSGTITFT